MKPGIYNLPSFTAGDTWGGVPKIRIRLQENSESEPEPPSSPLALVRLQFRRKYSDPVALVSLDSDTMGGIEIDDSEDWEISIPPNDLNLSPGEYIYDLETTDDDGIVTTYLAGTISIGPQVTR